MHVATAFPECRKGLIHSLIVTLLFAVVGQAIPTCASAETQVAGQPDAVRIEAREATVAEVLDALGSAFKLRYRSSTALTQSISGNYQGTLQRVVVRVLDGYDHIVKSSDDGIEVAIYAMNKGAVAVPVVSDSAGSHTAGLTNPAPAPTPASGWRAQKEKFDKEMRDPILRRSKAIPKT